MRISILKKIGTIGLATVFCFGCSSADSVNNQSASAPKNKDATKNKTSQTALSAPCTNRFYPVKNGLKRNYDNTIGGKSSQTMEYLDGDASFTEVTVSKDTTVKHVWRCTDEGLVAANYGSGAEVKNMQIEPKHISGVTLPKENEIEIDKT